MLIYIYNKKNEHLLDPNLICMQIITNYVSLLLLTNNLIYKILLMNILTLLKVLITVVVL